MRIFAAASAGPSNGAIAPSPSKAQPITIGVFAAVALGCAVAANAEPIAASAAMSAARDTVQLRLPLMLPPPSRRAVSSMCAYFCERFTDSRLPRAHERRLSPFRELASGNVPKRIGPRVSERAVVRKDHEVVQTIPPCAA